MFSLVGTSVEGHGTWLQATGSAGLSYDASTSVDDGVFRHFFSAYDNAFVLPNEKEGLAGFAECLALNDGCSYNRLCRLYGPFREFIVVVRDVAGNIVGGLNFITFPLADPDAGGCSLSLNLNYIFVPPAYRRRGILKTMVSELPILALALFGHTNPGDLPADCGASQPPRTVYTFIEQNDPYRMTAQDYTLDTQATGLDQLARIALWARQGARIVDFPYVQPALTADQEPDHNLVYAVLGASTSTLHPVLLRQHLERFFAISVLKGRDPAANVEARQQLARLAELAASGGRIALLEIADIARLPEPGAAHGPGDTSTLRRVLSLV
jgi:hypothetical protein